MAGSFYVLRPATDNLVRLRNLTNKAEGGGLIDTADPVAQVEDVNGSVVGSSFDLTYTGTSGLYEGIADATAVPIVDGSFYQIRIVMTTPLDRTWLVSAFGTHGG